MGEGVGGAPLDRGSILDICPVLKRKTYSPLFTVKEHLLGSGAGAFGLSGFRPSRGCKAAYLAPHRTPKVRRFRQVFLRAVAGMSWQVHAHTAAVQRFQSLSA